MTSYIYASVFSDPVSAVTPSRNTSSSTSAGGILTPQATTQSGQQTAPHGLATFICHVAYLDDKLQRGDKSAFFAADRARLTNRKRIGNGASFIVDRAELEEPKASGDTTQQSQEARQFPKMVVVKTVRDNRRNQNQWSEILLEIRALLHEPIRYHPNIVKLLDIRWDNSLETGSPFPSIIQEYAFFGTLDSLQRKGKILPFSIKQKLCYDVGRALSIIHACGMVHGDLKHENVLIFPNPSSDLPNQPYIAKLADFGGTVMDMGGSGTHRVPMHTFPYEAPEISERLAEEGAKKTDAYSYGMLIWRCIIDSQDILPILGFPRGNPGDEVLRQHVKLLKLSDGLLETAIHNISQYFFEHHLPSASFNLITSALMFTLRGDPKQRALDRAQVRLRGMDSVGAYRYVDIKDEANRRTMESMKYRTPGKHGMDMDSVGFALGRMGYDYDAQNNLPGFRPDLPRPERGGFLFDPLRLRTILDRGQQETMVREFELYAESAYAGGDTAEIKPEPWSAAYFLLQSYLCGFGVDYDPEKACYWLRRAAEPGEEQASTDYLAMAWVNRVHAALRVPNPYDVDKQIDNLFWSIVRGHVYCLEDAEALIEATGDEEKKRAWAQKMTEAQLIFKALTGSTGMPFFAPRKLTRPWDLDNLGNLDAQLKDELGREYDACLRPPSGTEEDPDQDDQYRFDKIYVNHKGHGILHLAAVRGKLPALKHLVSKYRCNINLKNQSHGDTALTCACRTGRFEMAMWLLENGADPNGGQFCEESPLHCLTSFSEAEMDALVAKLVVSGADIEKHSEASRKDVRGILADWEDSYAITLTPLGRAVLKQSLPGVRVLLKHGAISTRIHVDRNRANVSAVELAAVLTLPDILDELLAHTDSTAPVLNEFEMLNAARSGKITSYDSLSLQSRLVRCGANYQEALQRTLRILHSRTPTNVRTRDHTPGKHLCNEILLGNADIVEGLLSLGHVPPASSDHDPLATAVRANNWKIFKILIPHYAPTSSLLHTLASHSPTAPRSLAIAEYVLAHHPPDSTSKEPTDPTPLHLALLANNHPLANLLLPHYITSINALLATLPNATSDQPVSLLGSLLLSHTSSSLHTLLYLSQLHKSNTIKLSPHVATTDNLPVSAFHLLAAAPPATWNSHGQISESIIHLLLTIFPDPASLGELATRDALGPLGAAAKSQNLELVRILVATPYGAEDVKSIAEEAVSLQTAGTTPLDSIESVRRRYQILEIFTPVDWDEIDSQLKQDEERVKREKTDEPAIDRDGDGVNLPVDLSGLTDEKPSGWKEGVEMTAEMSLRVFLKHFRKSLGGDVVKEMGELFNKRAED